MQQHLGVQKKSRDIAEWRKARVRRHSSKHIVNPLSRMLLVDMGSARHRRNTEQLKLGLPCKSAPIAEAELHLP